MRDFSVSPREMVACLWRNKDLIRASVKRDILERYRGSMMGILWSFFNPLFMLAVYTIVFSVVFKSRWGTDGGSKTEFALVLFAGLMIFNIFAESINRAPTLIISNANYVKKVLYPLEILPVVSLVSSMFHALISLLVWMLAYCLFFGWPHLTIFLLPLIVLPFVMLTIGLSWALSSLGVYLRDVSQFIGVLTSVLMFMTPIFYPVSALPDNYRHFLYLNPLTPVVEMTRDVLYWGKVPDIYTMSIYWLMTAVIAWLGFALFQKTRAGFADVL